MLYLLCSLGKVHSLHAIFIDTDSELLIGVLMQHSSIGTNKIPVKGETINQESER